MQAATTGDVYTFTLVQTDGVTPIVTAGISTVVCAIQNPYGITATYTPSVTGNVATITTTPSTFPLGGNYKIQFVVTYGSGVITKSRVYTQVILPSID